MIPAISKYPPGNICIGSGDLGRYTQFNQSLAQLAVPMGTSVHWTAGSNYAQNLNLSLEYALKQGGWVFILPDDHVFKPSLLMRLLAREVDVVLPLCLSRWHPWTPTFRDLDGVVPAIEDLPDGGLVEVSTGGDAGILMGEAVLKATGPPWHDANTTDMDYQFGRKIAAAGFKFHVDLDNHIGHTTHVDLWPERQNGKWQRGLYLGRNRVSAVLKGGSE